MESFQTFRAIEKYNVWTCHKLPVTEKVHKLSTQASGLVNVLLPGMEIGPNDLRILHCYFNIDPKNPQKKPQKTKQTLSVLMHL